MLKWISVGAARFPLPVRGITGGTHGVEAATGPRVLFFESVELPSLFPLDTPESEGFRIGLISERCIQITHSLPQPLQSKLTRKSLFTPESEDWLYWLHLFGPLDPPGIQTDPD